jgi:hypothetical protein
MEQKEQKIKRIRPTILLNIGRLHLPTPSGPIRPTIAASREFKLQSRARSTLVRNQTSIVTGRS